MPRRQPADDTQFGLKAEDETDPGQTEQDHNPQRRDQIVGEEPQRPPPEEEAHRKKGHALHPRRANAPPGQGRTQLGTEHGTDHEGQKGDCSAKHVLSLLCERVPLDQK